MLNRMGEDRGAVPVLESAMLPYTTDAAGRTMTFARHTATQGVGHGIGALRGRPAEFAPAAHARHGDGRTTAWSLGVAGLTALMAAPLCLRLSTGLEVHREAAPPRVSAQGRRTIAKLSLLFSLDAIDGGFLSGAAIAGQAHRA